LRAILYKAKELDVEPPVLRSILASNTRHIEEAFRLVKNTGKRRIAILGLSFKVGTDDLRESPIAELVEMLVGKGYWLAVYDRDVSLARLHGSNRAYIEQTIPHLSRLLFESIDDAIAEADVIVVAKRSPEAEERLRTLGPDKILIDLAPSKSPNEVMNGAVYEGICW